MPIPVHIVTGSLGSGKTTLLRHLLQDPALADTAVVINEFGEIGLDHALVRQVADDVVLLASGCLCCSVRDDLVSTLARLAELAKAGEMPAFARLAVETTGLANPVPIAEAVLSDRRLARDYGLGAIVTTVDALLGVHSVQSDEVAAAQAAVADRIVISKTDLVTRQAVASLRDALVALNPSAQVIESRPDRMPPGSVLFAPLPAAQAARVPQTLPRSRPGRAAATHDASIATFTVQFDEPVDWAAFVEWIDLLLAARGEDMLRIKGLLAVQGERRPTVVQAVRHVVFPPERLDAWPERPGRSHLTFIVRHVSRTAVERSLSTVLGVTALPPAGAAAAQVEATADENQLPLS